MKRGFSAAKLKLGKVKRKGLYLPALIITVSQYQLLRISKHTLMLWEGRKKRWQSSVLVVADTNIVIKKWTSAWYLQMELDFY